MPVDILGQVLDVAAWQSLSACADPDLAAGANWFPDQHHARDAATERALEVCGGCPVRIECLLFSLVMDRHHDRGIFGGLSPRQRNRLRGTMARAGFPIAIRSCVQCGRRFAAVATTPRDKVCCSDACVRRRRRSLDRTSAERRRAKRESDETAPVDGGLDPVL